MASRMWAACGAALAAAAVAAASGAASGAEGGHGRRADHRAQAEHAAPRHEAPKAPGGGAVLGARGRYACTGGQGPARIEFRVARFEDGAFRIESTEDGRPGFALAYPWQLVGLSVVRERTVGGRTWRFRRELGSLDTIGTLPEGRKFRATYTESPTDASSEPVDWEYEVTVVRRERVSTPGAGEQEALHIHERRWTQVDGNGRPVRRDAGGTGFTREEDRRVWYAPALGVPVRIEVRTDDRRDGTRVCELASFTAPRHR